MQSALQYELHFGSKRAVAIRLQVGNHAFGPTCLFISSPKKILRILSIFLIAQELKVKLVRKYVAMAVSTEFVSTSLATFVICFPLHGDCLPAIRSTNSCSSTLFGLVTLSGNPRYLHGKDPVVAPKGNKICGRSSSPQLLLLRSMSRVDTEYSKNANTSSMSTQDLHQFNCPTLRWNTFITTQLARVATK